MACKTTTRIVISQIEGLAARSLSVDGIRQPLMNLSCQVNLRCLPKPFAEAIGATLSDERSLPDPGGFYADVPIAARKETVLPSLDGS